MRFSGPVLGIETSCDETSAAILEDGRILGHIILTQDAHERFGGIVPEIAARAHLRQIDLVVEATFDEAGISPADIAGVGVTAGPGLIGALLVGLNWAKGLAWALAPSVIEQMLEVLRALPETARRQVGLLAIVGGLIFVWIAHWIGV